MSDRASSEFLAPDDLRALTGRAHVNKQAEWLAEHGIPHRLEGRRLIVCRVHARAWIEGRAVLSSGGPNWATVN